MGFEGRVYLVTNLINGKRYVGQTTYSIARRWQGHVSEARCGKDHVIDRAIRAMARKYGYENLNQYFEVTELSSGCTSPKALDALEKHWIAKLKTLTHSGWGYNSQDGGQSGGLHGVETREKMSLSGFKRVPDSLETRLSKRQGQIRRWATLEVREQQSKTQLISQNRPAVQTKRSTSLKSFYNKPEGRAKLKAIQALRWSKPEAHVEQSARTTALWSNPERRAKMGAAVRLTKRRQKEAKNAASPDELLGAE